MQDTLVLQSKPSRADDVAKKWLSNGLKNILRV